MKKGLMMVFVALGTLCLTACDLFHIGGKENSASVDTGDKTVYGTGADNLSLVVGTNIPAGEYVAFFKAPANQPEGADPITAGYVGVYNGSVTAQNMLWEDDFQTTSMCTLVAGQTVNLKYATLQNINSNPQIGALKNGVFKIGVHVRTNNGTLKVRAIGQSGTFSSTAGQAIFFSELRTTGYYNDNPNWGAVNNLATDEVKEFPLVPDGIYIQLNSAEIVVE